MKKNISILIVIIIVVAGILGFKYYNEQKQLETVRKEETEEEKEKLELLKEYIKMQVFIEDGVGEEKVSKIGKELKKIECVSDIEFVFKEDALEQMKELLGEESSELLKGYEGDNNVFPASYIIHFEFEDLESFNYEKIEEEMNNIDGVKSVSSSISTLLEFYEKDMLEEFIEKYDETIN